MAKIRINGDSSGYVDLEAPNAASSSTLDLDQVPQKNAANTFSAVNKFTDSVAIGGTHSPVNNLDVRSTGQAIVRVDGVGLYFNGIKIRNNYSSVQSDWNVGAAGGTSGWGSANGTFIVRDDTTNSTGLEIEQGAGSNTAALHINSSGYVTTPSQPSFKAGLDTNANVSSGNNIIFNSTSTYGKYNTGGHYSTTNGRFTAPVSGAYHFDVGLLYGPSVPDGTNFDDCAFLYLNGVLAAYDERRAEYVNGTTGNSGYYGTWIHTQLYMNSGDYVSVVNYNRFAGVHGNQRFTWFAGFLIG